MTGTVQVINIMQGEKDCYNRFDSLMNDKGMDNNIIKFHAAKQH